MILLPIGRDNAVIQRHAWVTYGILCTYFAAFLVIAILHKEQERAYVEDVRAIQLVLAKYPEVALPKQLEVILGKEKYDQLNINSGGVRPLYGGARTYEAQKRLDELAVSAVEHYRNLGQIRYSYRPDESSMFTVLLSMWVQFSFIAFLGDCFVLFSTAPYLEDVFGRPAFVILYFGGALAAAAIYASFAKDPTIGMYGAAGAVSASVGAFFVRFFKSKLEFFFVPFIWRPQHRYRFFVPAWGAIPFWAALQLWVATKEYGGGAVANLGGFAFGAFFAGGMILSKYEAKHVAPAVAQQTTWMLNEHLVRAAEAIDPILLQGELVKFFPLKPANDEELQTAIDLARQALEDAPPAPFCAQVAAFADRHRAYDLATIAYDRVCQLEPNSPNTLRHLLRLGTLKKQTGDVIGARTALMRAKTHAGCSDEIRSNIDARLAQLRA